MFVYKLLTRSFKDMERVANETKRTVLFNVTFGQKLIFSSNEHSKKMCPNMRPCRFNWCASFRYIILF
jgi:hypothetical protein